ncbi:MAG: protein-disulfide isomerase, partial [Rhodospirillales bacterium 20-64-7]
MQTPHLIYFADPMCSWCWGFSPAIGAIAARFGETLPIRLVLGGLRPGTEQEMTAGDRANVRGHWEHVQEASGQPFDFRFFDRPSFVYDTEPASRAVVAMRRLGMNSDLEAFRRIQFAFYAENRDVTETETLCALAAELGADADAFRS